MTSASKVVITHFINPHMFWYYEVDLVKALQLRELESNLQIICETPNFHGDLPLQIDNYVAVKYLAWDKFIRAEIMHRPQNVNEDIVVWAIDYGFPFLSKTIHMRILPISMTKSIDRIKCGGIHGVIPASLKFNSLKGGFSKNKQENWDQWPCDFIKKNLLDAEFITFIEKYETAEGHHWGNLIISNYKGDNINVFDYLINGKYALEVCSDFESLLNNLKTIKSTHWMPNDVQLNSSTDSPKTNHIHYNAVDRNPKRNMVVSDEIFRRKADRWRANNGIHTQHLYIKSNSENIENAEIDYLLNNTKLYRVINDNYYNNFIHGDLAGQLKQNNLINKLAKLYLKSINISTNELESPHSDYFTVRYEGFEKRQTNLIKSEQYTKEALLLPICDSSYVSPNIEKCMKVRAKYVKREVGPSDVESTATSIATVNNIKIQKLLRFQQKYCINNIEDDIDNVKKVESGQCSTQETECFNNNALKQKCSKLRAKYIKNEIEAASIENLPTPDVSSCNPLHTPYHEKLRQKSTINTFGANARYFGKANGSDEDKVLKESSGENIKSSSEVLECSDISRKNEIKELDPFKGCVVIPGGFDWARFGNYRNEDKHWHRKNITVYTEIPNYKATLATVKKIERRDSEVLTLQNNSVTMSPLSQSHIEKIDLHLKENMAKNKTNPPFENFTSSQDINCDAIKEFASKCINNQRERKLELPISQIKEISSILINKHEEKENANGKDRAEIMNTSKISKKCHNFELTSMQPYTVTNNHQNCISVINKEESINKNNFEKLIDKCLLKMKEDDNLNINSCNVLLCHSSAPLNFTDNINELFFPEIYKEMLGMHTRNVYQFHMCSWSHIIRGQSYFIVNSRKRGKTWSYLPAVCHLVCIRWFNQVTTHAYGPLAIILAASSRHVEHLTKLCRRILRGFKNEAPVIVSSFGLKSFNETRITLLNGCGILIATPASLQRLINKSKEERLFDAERIRHIIIDDLHLMKNQILKDLSYSLKAILKICTKTQNDKIVSIPQIIVTSNDWDSLMANLIIKSIEPLLLIGDFLEAAVYGGAVILINFVSQSNKNEQILKFITNDGPEKSVHEDQYSLLIMCSNDNDVKVIVEYLKNCGYPSLGYCKNYGDNNIELYNTINRHKHKPFNGILVCTDEYLHEIEIPNTCNLIHYSMPTSWTKFTQRFSVFGRLYKNFVQNKFVQSNSCNNYIKDKSSTERCRSLILLDEGNNVQLPRLIDFMLKHNQYVHSGVVAATENERKAAELVRISKYSLLCSQLLEFGDCNESYCAKRHQIINSDLVKLGGDIPINGELRVRILKVFSPTHYAAQLLMHKPLNAKEWSEIGCSAKADNFAVNINKHYKDKTALIKHWPPKLNDICIYVYLESYKRARIISVDESAEFTLRNHKITLKLIDDGLIIPGVNCDEIFQCDEKFKEFEVTVINLRLCNVVPYDNERCWDTDATNQVEKWILKDITADHIVQANINFALAETIWIKNVIVMGKLNTVGTYIQLMNVKMALIEKQFGVQSYVENWKTIRDKAEKLLLSIVPTNTNNNLSFNSTKDDTVNENSQSNSSSDLNEKIYEIEVQNEEETPKQKNNSATLEQVESPHEINEERVVQECSNDTKNNNKEKWCELPLNKMVKVEIGDESENGNWEDIFLQLIDKEHVKKFDQLNNFINEYIKKQRQKKHHQQQNDDHLIEFWKTLKPLNDCIIKYDNLYLRAKLCGIFGNGHSELYRFFLCDYARFLSVDSINLNDDIFYETTDEIINFTPFQAIHCNLAGLKWNRYCKRYNVTKDYLYACGVENNSTKNPLINQAAFDLPINSYKILLFESENEDDLENIEMFNLTLLEKGITEADPKTEHFLNYAIRSDNDSNNNEQEGNNDVNNPVSFKEFLQCLERSLMLDYEQLSDSEQFEPNQLPCKGEILPKETKLKKETCQDVKISKTTQTKSPDEKTNSEGLKKNLQAIPPLKVLYKRPQLTWYDTDCLICLSIHVPDVKKYFLQISESCVEFTTTIEDVNYALILHLLGCVQPELVSHEVRGLNVIIWLVKVIYIKWPRLLYEETKHSWIKYNYNLLIDEKLEAPHDDTINIEHNSRNEIDVDITSEDNSDSSDSDTEKILYQTYNKVNIEDNMDPMF